MPKPGEPLTRQRVLDAALHLIDREGLEGFSMRKLGAMLGVEAMSLYNHVEYNIPQILDLPHLSCSVCNPFS
jgi:AcrR family transcriptional regulator